MFPSQNNEIPSSAKTGLKTPYYTTPVLLWRKPRDFYKYIVNSLISNCCLQLDSQPIRSEKWLGCSFILPVYVVGQIGPLFEFSLLLNPRLLLLIKLLHKSLWFCFHETQLGPLYFLLRLLLRATWGARNPNLQVFITRASHVCSQHSFGLPLRMNGTMNAIWSRAFRPPTPRNRNMCVLTIYHVKLT